MSAKFKLAKLGLTFVKAVSKHRKKILHIADAELLVRDLGHALNEQHQTLTNPRNSTIETAYEIVPQIAEVRVLTNVIAKHLNIDTKDKDHSDILKEIVDQMEAKDSDAAEDIKQNLKWLDEFYSSDEAKELMEMDVTEIETPSGVLDYKGAFKAVTQTASRAFEETQKAHKFMSLAKKFQEMQRRRERQAQNDNDNQQGAAPSQVKDTDKKPKSPGNGGL